MDNLITFRSDPRAQGAFYDNNIFSILTRRARLPQCTQLGVDPDMDPTYSQ